MKKMIVLFCFCIISINANARHTYLRMSDMQFNQHNNYISINALGTIPKDANNALTQVFEQKYNSGGTVGINSLDSPVLISPSTLSTDITESPILVWNSVANALTYTVQLSTNNAFTNNKIDINIAETQKFVLKLPYSGTYYWRVKSNNGAMSSAWSEVWSFTTKAKPNNGYYLWAWGLNDHYQCSNAYPNPLLIPSQIQFENNWTSISSSFYNTFAIKADGTLWSMGGSTQAEGIPQKITNDNDWAMIARGEFAFFAIKTDGSLWAWGMNNCGQLGDGTITSKSIPTRIGTETDWAYVEAGIVHTIALKNDGTMWATGYNNFGQLGNGTNVNSRNFIQIGNGYNWAKISCNIHYSLGLANDGTLWAWGQNDNAQLGDGTTINKSSPVQIGLTSDWADVSSNSHNSIAIKLDGTLWAWGENAEAQLGDGTTISIISPTQIGSDNDWSKIAVGSKHSLALKTDGTLWSWGENFHGQLGNNTLIDNYVPVKIGTDSDWQAIASQNNVSIALKTGGTPPTITSTPTVAYIIPDIGTPGMNTYMEINSNTNEFGAYGADRTIINPYSDPDLKIEFKIPDDNKKIDFGPLVVSWGGRMIATQVFVNPNMPQPDHWNYGLISPEFIVEFRVVSGANASAWQSFYIVQPWPIQDLSNNTTDNVFGENRLGKRSPRGCMIVESLNLNSINYTVSTNDCDLNTPGNQGYLPFILLAKGNITGKTVGANTTTISLDAPSAPDAAPGGGGGGGKFCDFSGNGYDGGKGFVGGGPGGFNKAGNPFSSDSYKNWGESSGNNGNSINGVQRPERKAYENAGGGTGHPFGISGQAAWVQTPNQLNNGGGYGGGSGDDQSKRGGGAGYSSIGLGSNLFNGGEIYGNQIVVPIAGGSGGASGNPQGASNCSGNGGGGGGAIRIFARDISNVMISAKGGNGSNGDGNTHGGGGSGGYVGVFAKNKVNQVVANVTGGITPGLGTNGSGRVRVDVYEETNLTHLPAAEANAKYSGFTIDTTTYVRRNCTIKGTKQMSDILDIYWKSQSASTWTHAGPINNSGTTWSQPLNLTGTDSVYYVLATKQISGNRHLDSVQYTPDNDFSQAAANILIIDKFPEIDGENTSEIKLDYCVGNIKHDTVRIWNKGKAPLLVDMPKAKFRNNTPGFEFQPKKLRTLRPIIDTLDVIISYTVQAGATGTITDVLEIQHNDLAAINQPWLVACTAKIDEFGGEFYDAAKTNKIIELDFGNLCPNTPRPLTALVKNISANDVELDDFVLAMGNNSKFKATITNRTLVKDGFVTFDVEFLGNNVSGLSTDQLFLRLKGCPNNLATLVLNAKVIEPMIGFEKDTVDLGIVCKDKSANIKTLEITNLTELPLDLTYTILPAINGLSFNLSPNSKLEAKGNLTANIGFNATGLADGPYNWKIALNDANCGNFTDTIYVSAKVQTTTLEADPTSDFGLVQVGFNQTNTITLKNNGTGYANINSLPIAKAPFYIVSSIPNVPTQIAPNGQIAFNVIFKPTAQGTFYDTLRFESIETGTSCSALDSTLLVGKASLPEVLVSPTDIDFGLWATCQKQKDKFTVTNVGTFAVNISKVEIIGVNKASFRIISQNGNTPLTLPANGGSQEYEIEYDASVLPIGIHNAEVVFTASTDIPKVNLKGENESVNVLINPNSPIDLGAIPVGNSQNQVINITNNSRLPVSINSIVSSSPDCVVSPSNFDLNAGETKQISATINANTVGDISHTIDYKIAAPCPEDKQIVLSATGLEGKIEYNNLDFKVLTSCESKLDYIIITNTGDADITINSSTIIDDIENVFILQNPITTAIVLKPEAIDKVNSFYKLNVVFDPRNSTDGIKTAKVLLKCIINAQNAELKPQLSGERRSGILLTPKSVGFQNTRQNSVSSKSLNLKNIGQQIINITGVKLPKLSSVFRVTPQTMSAVLNPNADINFSIEFAPTAIQPYLDTLTVYYRVQTCNDSVKIALSGTGVQPTIAIIRLPHILDINPRDVELDIPIYAKLVDSDDDVPINNLGIVMQVQLNGTLYFPTGIIPSVHKTTNTIDLSNKRTMLISLNNVSISKDEKIIGTIQGVPLLGNSIETPLAIKILSHDNLIEVSSIETEDGLLSYTICQNDGDRLIEYKQALDMRINPNPPGDIINLEITTLEQGNHILKIVNALGEEQVIESWNSDGKTNNSKKYSIPTEKYSSGTYLLILQGPNRMTTQQLQIIK